MLESVYGRVFFHNYKDQSYNVFFTVDHFENVTIIRALS